jgi:ABC-type multidrug transport system ATPase subunit
LKAIRVHNVTYRYKGAERPAIEQIRFDVDRGEIVGLLGHNGAGKTTLLKCISGLLTPAEGTVNFGEGPEDGRGTVQSLLGYVPSDIYLYNLLTVEEMVRFTASLHKLDDAKVSERMNGLLAAFQLSEKRHEYIKTLSHGMKQKVALITGVIHHPNALLLDEPMTGYDALSTKETKNFLLRYAQENHAGVLLSSHRLDIVEDICNRVVVIHNGKLVFDGGIRELKQNAFDSKTLEEALLRLSADENQTENG